MKNKYTKAFNHLVNNLIPIAKDYGVGLSWFLYDAACSYVRYGITPNEYLGFQFYRFSTIERKRFYTARDADKWEERFNNKEYAHIFNHKPTTNRVFSTMVNRDWLYVAESTLRHVINFIDSHDKVIVKPVGLSSGRGIYILKNSERQDFICCLMDQNGITNTQQIGGGISY